MFLRIELDKFEIGYARFLRRIRLAIQETFEEQKKLGVSQSSIASELNVHRSVVSKRLSGSGNVTLRTISDLFIAMGREPLENFSPCDENVTYSIVCVVNDISAQPLLLQDSQEGWRPFPITQEITEANYPATLNTSYNISKPITMLSQNLLTQDKIQ